MPSHPDADAFIRAILRNPIDETIRLVFADWLEETGEESNIAWARFIRLRTEAARHRFGSRLRSDSEAQATGYESRICAKLMLPAAVFVSYRDPLLQLLPASNISVSLGRFKIRRAVLDLVPASVAQENLVLPLDLQGNDLLVAVTDPRNYDTIQKLHFILSRDMVPVRAEEDDIRSALVAHNGRYDVENVDTAFHEFVDTAMTWFDPAEHAVAGSEESPVTRLVNQLLLEAINSGANRVHIQPGRVEYRIGGEWVTRNELPRRLLPGVAMRIALMTGIVPDVGREDPDGGEFRFNYHGAIYTVRTTIDLSALGPVIDLDISDYFELA
jgi:uncharacterized protein (TIGR02996 family)